MRSCSSHCIPLVSHFVNHRSLRVNESEKGYVFAFVGDEQATPHFMRYSGLTGACINAMLFNNFIKQANDGVPFVDRLREYSTETNWSNGEVVQRGTGSNYGEDGFLRPGFSYECVIDYLHSKVIEHQATGQDMDNILSRDWKAKLAASLVPRGLEMNESYIRKLYDHLHTHTFDKFAKEVMGDKRIGQNGLEKTLKARGLLTAGDREVLNHDAFWYEFLEGIDEKTKNVLREHHIVVAKRLHQMCRQVIEHAKEAYLYNQRISSEISNSPKNIDSIVDDLAVEAQNFATSLAQSAAFAAGALAFKLVGDRVAIVFSTILAVVNIGISFGTMTSSARYKIRNEEARIVIAEKKMLGVVKGVFAAMDRDRKEAIPVEENPFVTDLEEELSVFLKNLEYYNFEEPKEFLFAFQKLKAGINDPTEIHAFMTLLTTHFIVDTYHVNSYVQESLVNIYKTLDEMLRMLTDHCSIDADKGVVALTIFRRLDDFRGELEGTLQRGATRFGFVKRRRLLQWDCIAMFKYLYSLVWCSTRFCFLPTAQISTKTLSLIKHAKYLSHLHGSKILLREIRDLESLHWATRESDIASLVFCSGFFVFVASFAFELAHILKIDVLVQFAFWATLTSAFGAILGTFHLWRKLLILVNLMLTLTSKHRSATHTELRDNIAKVRGVTFAQIILTLGRLLSAGAAAIALPWSVANNAFPDLLVVNNEIPFWIALGAVCTAILSTLFFFLVEYRLRYNLPPKLGEFVAESFRSEIEEIYRTFSIPMNDIDTKQAQERETWEYTAREFLHRYRFDAVFAADRFGTILQYIQAGMDRRE